MDGFGIRALELLRLDTLLYSYSSYSTKLQQLDLLITRMRVKAEIGAAAPLSLPGDVLHRLRQLPTQNFRKVVAEASSCEKKIVKLNLINVNCQHTNESNEAHGKEGGVLVAVAVRDIVDDNGGDDLPDAGESGEQPDGDRSEGGRVDTEREEDDQGVGGGGGDVGEPEEALLDLDGKLGVADGKESKGDRGEESEEEAAAAHEAFEHSCQQQARDLQPSPDVVGQELVLKYPTNVVDTKTEEGYHGPAKDEGKGVGEGDRLEDLEHGDPL